ncbi:MAG: hypothetical protein JXB49_33925 [Bacteroidales bacterium]|nr:hypothetical protein [Bacteroidales bacterium]
MHEQFNSASFESPLTSHFDGESISPIHTDGLPHIVSNDQLAFKGFFNVEPIADLQNGPTCGFEAIENFIQLNNPNISNNLSEYLQNNEIFDFGGQLSEGGITLDPNHYQHILNDFGIRTAWLSYNSEILSHAISENHGVLVVGDAHYLNPEAYPNKGSYHAFMVTDTIKDSAGAITAYKGLDSNFPNQESIWSSECLENAINHSPLKQQLLVSDTELDWPYKTLP